MLEIATYRSKPIQAIKIGEDLKFDVYLDEIKEFTGAFSVELRRRYNEPMLFISVEDKTIIVGKDDYVIKDGDGNVYSAHEDPFHETFELVEETDG